MRRPGAVLADGIAAAVALLIVAATVVAASTQGDPCNPHNRVRSRRPNASTLLQRPQVAMYTRHDPSDPIRAGYPCSLLGPRLCL